LDDKIGLDLSAILENDTILNTPLDFTEILSDPLGLNCISVVIIEDLTSAENIDFNCASWDLFAL